MGDRNKKKEKKCELCWLMEAKTYCDSDGASLCWECDAKVHGANFLVAKHRRSLLCRLCFSLTPWSSSGPSLSPSLSLCPSCFQLNYTHCHDDDDIESSEEDEEESEEDEEESEEEENQVVPWSKPTSSSSSSV